MSCTLRKNFKMKLSKLILLLIGSVVVLNIVLAGSDRADFEESYRKISKEELKKYVKILEMQAEDIPDFTMSDCGAFKYSKGIEPKQRFRSRFCMYYLNVKGIAEGKPPKGLALPVKGQDKVNLDEDGAWGILDMQAIGLKTSNNKPQY